MKRETTTVETPAYEDLSCALQDDADVTTYPSVQLPDGTEGWYIGCSGDTPGTDDQGLYEPLYEKFGERLFPADGCTVEVDKDGRVTSYGSSPFVISYAVRKTPEEIARETSKPQRLVEAIRRLVHR